MTTFYKVTTPTGKINYLLGTMHGGNEITQRLPLEIKEAFENSNSCLFENDFNAVESEGPAIKILVENWCKKTNEFLETDANKPYLDFALKHFKNKCNNNSDEFEKFLIQNVNSLSTPILLAFGLLANETEPPTQTVSMDAKFLNQAKITNKQCFFLETYTEIMEKLYGYEYSYQEHLDFFNFIVGYLEKGGEKFMPLPQQCELYLAGDIKALKDMYSLILTEDAPLIVKKYIHGLFTDIRDSKYAEGMKKHFEMGNVFAAVGAAHLPDIIDILSADNYKIEPISLSERLYDVSDMKKSEKIKLVNNELSISFFNQNKTDSINTQETTSCDLT